MIKITSAQNLKPGSYKRTFLIVYLQVLAYADDVNLIGNDIRTIERNADVLLNACKDISLAVSTGKTKYMEIGRRGKIAN